MSAKQQALKDIKSDLESEGKSFIAFHRELNTPIRNIVNQYLKQQKKIKK